MIVAHIDEDSTKMAVTGSLQDIATDYVRIGREIYNSLRKKGEEGETAADLFKALVRSSALNNMMFDRESNENEVTEDEVKYLDSLMSIADALTSGGVKKYNPLEGATER